MKRLKKELTIYKELTGKDNTEKNTRKTFLRNKQKKKTG